MFNIKKPLLYQLGYPHLLKVYSISNQLFNINKLKELNNLSLKYRKKL